MMNSALFIFRTGPYGSSQLKEGLDMAMATAVFDREVTLLFESDAVTALLDTQQPEVINQPNLFKQLSSLPIYGIEQILVAAESLESLPVNADDLPDFASVTQVSPDFVSQFDQVMVY